MILLVYLVIGLAFAYCLFRIAPGKGRDPTKWAILGLFFGVFAVAVFALLPSRNGPTTDVLPAAGIEAMPED